MARASILTPEVQSQAGPRGPVLPVGAGEYLEAIMYSRMKAVILAGDIGPHIPNEPFACPRARGLGH